MRIAVIGHLKHPITKPFAGGLEMFTHALVTQLVSRRHDVTLFASGDSHGSLPVSPVVARGTIGDSIRRFGSEDHTWIEATEDEAYAELMTKLMTSRFDVIHNNSLSPIPLHYAEFLNDRMVTTLHVPILPRLEKEIRSRGASHCGRFINISRTNRLHWSSLIGDHPVIQNGIDTTFWKPVAIRKKNRAVWFGRILPDKGTHYAIEAAHRAGLPIDIVGPVSDRTYLQDQVIPRLTIDDRLLGHRSHEKICAIVSRAAVAIVTPCWDEPFGLVAAESLACGTPVAAFARGAMPEILTPDIGCLATPADLDSLANAIRNCLVIDGSTCRKAAEERFCVARMIDQYETMYQIPRPEIAA